MVGRYRGVLLTGRIRCGGATSGSAMASTSDRSFNPDRYRRRANHSQGRISRRGAARRYAWHAS